MIEESSPRKRSHTLAMEEFSDVKHMKMYNEGEGAACVELETGSKVVTLLEKSQGKPRSQSLSYTLPLVTYPNCQRGEQCYGHHGKHKRKPRPMKGDQ